MYDDYLFFDIEVFKYNTMVVFKDIEEKTVKVFSSSLEGLGSYVDKGVSIKKGFKDLKKYVKGKTLVGYNNHYYDDRIMKALMFTPSLREHDDLRQRIIKAANDSIINNKPLGWLKNTKDHLISRSIVFNRLMYQDPHLRRLRVIWVYQLWNHLYLLI